ncbi:MAG: hypothetical protein LBR60_05480 [Fibrobacter sp.]|nr:hypothetical protein [Fibrobacter sp.]
MFFLSGCASQRQKAVCSEIEIRLNTMDYSAEQRDFLEQELRSCKEQQQEYAKTDTLTNKVKKSIYELYQESVKDSAATGTNPETPPESETKPPETENSENHDAP